MFGGARQRHEEGFWEGNGSQTDGFGGVVGLLGMVWERNCDKTYVVRLQDRKDVRLAGAADYCGGDGNCELPGDGEPMRIDDCLSG